MKRLSSSSAQQGFTYLIVLGLLAALAIGLATAAEVWTTTVQREREADLDRVGLAWVRAIERYHRAPGVGARTWPRTVDQLLADDRFTPPLHYLRQAYTDPLVPGQAFDLVMSPDGGIVGVRSTSTQQPLRTTSWGDDRHPVAPAAKYSDLLFVADPGGA